MLDLVKTIGFGLILFLPLTNPLTTVALLLGLSNQMTNDERNHQANMTCIYVFFIMVISFYFGQLVMTTFGISIPGLRIAGGMIVAFIGFRMLFPQPKIKPVESPSSNSQTTTTNNIAFVPLAMPSTAGPGTIAMIISMASTVKSGQYHVASWVIYASSLLVPLLLCIILWICLRSAGEIMRLMGPSGIDAISRIMGFLLVCMGVQFMINGVYELIEHYPHMS